jgi:hypothetical protein
MSQYADDFYAWTQTQAAALRAKDWVALDLENLAEEIESLGKRDRRAVESYLEVIAKHLLKWRYQPARRTPSWRHSVRQARTRLSRLLRDHRTLRAQVDQLLADAYPAARRAAAEETGLPLATFPEACPWPAEQLQDEDFWPEEGR